MYRRIQFTAMLLTSCLIAPLAVHANELERRQETPKKITAANRAALSGLLPSEFLPYVEDYADLSMTVVPSESYAPHATYQEATKKYACQASLDADGHLRNYTAGQPFPYSEWAKEITGHRCDLEPNDPQFAQKLAWNVNFRWQGAGLNIPHFGFSYIRNWGNDTWRVTQGEYRRTYFSHRADIDGHSLDPGSDVEWAEFFDVKTPFDLRGTMFLLFRYNYEGAEKEDQTYAYIPSLRRVRRVSTTQKSDALLGTEFTLEDFYAFSGYVYAHKWEFHGENSYLGMMNTRRLCFPSNMSAEEAARSEGETRLGSREEWNECKWGPYNALPFADETWEKRTVFQLDDIPQQEGHPYSRKKIFYDKETLQPLYLIAYDRAGEPFRLAFFTMRWSEDSEVPENRGKRVPNIVAGQIVNVQNGNSHVTSFWNSNARTFDSSTTERYYDTSRLKKQGR